ncbi:DUF3742 family protein [Kosakonia cowanii]|uniref:DUF3742 family protein n=1 Tax=Kosakonia cowanii TaxID=208223 RepID=UPI00345BDA66
MGDSAFKRGAHAAGLWRKLSKSARAANSACVEWAIRRGLPAFVGRLPVPITGIAILAIALVSGFFIGAVLLLGAIFLYILSNLAVTSVMDCEVTEEQNGHQYRDGNDGFGIYSGPQNVTVTSSRIDHDDD